MAFPPPLRPREPAPSPEPWRAPPGLRAPEPITTREPIRTDERPGWTPPLHLARRPIGLLTEHGAILCPELGLQIEVFTPESCLVVPFEGREHARIAGRVRPPLPVRGKPIEVAHRLGIDVKGPTP